MNVNISINHKYINIYFENSTIYNKKETKILSILTGKDFSHRFIAYPGTH